ncbi:hypothetical protein BGZ88_006476 [Linnemannia elongata]|nr:hypothetical protein BGZ88_006476 [Linnemannia elongata]KAF9338902.1 hypothetical protein BGZ91_007620 [Linnemannia elongata]KAG0068315.1 hypothetical protein BGZ89_004931 [Linnemannia elongata]KAG0075045.1 hypothetical protein BGZ90_010245 [Linnemannia elongata]
MRIIPVPVLEDNYAYVLLDEKTSEAAVIDPVEPQKLLHMVQHLNAKLTSVLITHHHWDHSNGNVELLAKKPGLAVFGADARIPEINYVVKDKEEFKVGSLTVQALWTPCHTKGSVCFFIKDGNDCAVFTGDTLFLSGCGRFFEGTAADMYNSLLHVLATLPVETKVYCGHEYTKANLKFANHVEPENAHVAQKLQWVSDESVKSTIPGTIGEELLTNPFLRVNEPSLQAFTGKNDPIDVMHALRELKNNFK